MPFTEVELAEMRAADEEIEREFEVLTLQERKASMALDSAAKRKDTPYWKYRERRIAYSRKWQKTHREEWNAYQKAYKASHPEYKAKAVAYSTEYNKRNREKRNAYRRERYARKKAAKAADTAKAAGEK